MTLAPSKLCYAAAFMFVAPSAMSQDGPLASELPGADHRRTATQTLVAASYPQEEAIVSPDGLWIAFTQSGVKSVSPDIAKRDGSARAFDGAPTGGIFVVSISGGDPRLVTSFASPLTDLAWSPDGSRLSFLARPREALAVRLYLVDIKGGAPNSVLGDSQYEPRNYVWLPDGDIFMTAKAGKRIALFVVSPKTRHIREVDGRSRPTGWSHRSPHPDPRVALPRHVIASSEIHGNPDLRGEEKRQYPKSSALFRRAPDKGALR